MQCTMAGRRIVVFRAHGGGADSVLDDARAIRAGGGNGSIIGQNQRFPCVRDEALKLLDQLVSIYAD